MGKIFSYEDDNQSELSSKFLSELKQEERDFILSWVDLYNDNEFKTKLEKLKESIENETL